jgi:uncharacterized protein
VRSIHVIGSSRVFHALQGKVLPVTEKNTSGPGQPLALVDVSKRRFFLLSPVLVIALGFGLAELSTSRWGAWSWVPVLLFYWAVLIALIAWGASGAVIRRWLGPSKTDRWIWAWRVLSLVVPALFLPTAFLPGLASISGGWVPILWFGLGAVNAWIEEGYWRGLLLDAASGWPGWLAVSYSAICFGACHPLLLGWQAGDTGRWLTYFLGTMLAGLIWGLVYRRTGSLRLPILGHFLQQMFAPPYEVLIQLADLMR